MTDHRAELSAQAEAYLQELRAAAAAAHERVMAGVRLQPQVHVDEPVPQAEFVEEQLPETDPIFATREFDVPPEALAGLVDFDVNE
jgi:hypothetical protein